MQLSQCGIEKEITCMLKTLFFIAAKCVNGGRKTR